MLLENKFARLYQNSVIYNLHCLFSVTSWHLGLLSSWLWPLCLGSCLACKQFSIRLVEWMNEWMCQIDLRLLLLRINPKPVGKAVGVKYLVSMIYSSKKKWEWPPVHPPMLDELHEGTAKKSCTVVKKWHMSTFIDTQVSPLPSMNKRSKWSSRV